MNKSGLIEIISMEFKLSYSEAKDALNECFNVIKERLIKGKSVELQKLGKFKADKKESAGAQADNIVKFIAVKKINTRINSDFDNLKKIKLKITEKLPYPDDDNLDFKISDEFIKKMKKDFKNDSITETQIMGNEKSDPPRTVISAKVIDLHNEIINSKTNGKN